MKRLLAITVVALTALGMASQDAAAQRRAPAEQVYIGPFPMGDERVFWSGMIIGAGTTGAYFAIENKRSLRLPGDGRNFNTGAFALTTVGCMAISPMLAAAWVHATEGRPLTSREALGLGAGCIIPFIGPLLVDAHFNANPQWEAKAKPAAPAPRRTARKR